MQSTLSTLQASAERLRLAFDLFEAGVAMERQRLRRLYPTSTEGEIDARLQAWLYREGEPGDAEGHVVAWPRTSP